MNTNRTDSANTRPYLPFLEVWGGFLFGSILCFSAFTKFDFLVPPSFNAVLGDFGVLVFIGLVCAGCGVAGATLSHRQWEKHKRFPLIAVAGYAIFAVGLITNILR